MKDSSYHLDRLSRALGDLEGIYQEYKERNSIPELLKEEEALLVALKSLLDTRSTPTWLKSADQKRMLYINPAYTDEFGLNFEEYAGLLDEQVHVHGQLYSNNDDLVLTRGHEMEFEEMVCINGADVLYKVKKWPVYLFGVVLGIAGESLGPVNESD